VFAAAVYGLVSLTLTRRFARSGRQPNGRRPDVQRFSHVNGGLKTATPDYVEFRIRHSFGYFGVRRNDEYTAECRQPEFWRREIFHVTTRYSVIIISARSIVLFGDLTLSRRRYKGAGAVAS